MSYPHSATAVANFFLESGWRDQVPVDPMKLQKLVYIGHGWNLALFDRPLIQEGVQAWRHGPVVPDLYHRLKHFGSEPIDHHVKDATGLRPGVPEWDDEAGTLLNRVWTEYGQNSGSQLRRITHEQGTPWDWVQKFYGGQIPRGATIPNNIIRDHYRSLVSISGNRPSLGRGELVAIGIAGAIDPTGHSLSRLRSFRKDRSDGLRRDGLKVAGDFRRAFDSVGNDE